MSNSVFSAQWYRVAGLHPRLRAHVRVTRQIYRNEVWHVLADPVSGHFHRINATAYAFVGRCDGRHSVDEISEALLAGDPDSALTQDEIVRLLVQLNQHGLIQCELTPDVESIFHREALVERQQRRLAINPLAFRVRLGDPTAILARFDPWLRTLFARPILALCVVLILTGALTAAMNLPELSLQVRTRMGTPRFLLMAWLLYPFIKAIHEFAHALAIRRFGGEVHQMGVSLLVLMPAPFVDASAASAFPLCLPAPGGQRRGHPGGNGDRGPAVILWALVEPGLVRDAALVVAFICGVSTLFFNGNPLLRFDGYFVLCDALDLPNLGLSQPRLVALRDIQSPPRPRRACIARSPAGANASGCPTRRPPWHYRLVLSIAIVAWIGSWSTPLGLLAGHRPGLAMVFRPVARLLAPPACPWPCPCPSASGPSEGRRGPESGRAVLFCLVPLPFATVGRGVVWVPEQAQLRTGTDGFIAHLDARHGEQVAGQVLARMSDNRLVAEAVKLRSQLEALDVDLYQAMLRDPVKARNVEEEMVRLRSQLGRIGELQGLLVLRAGVSGAPGDAQAGRHGGGLRAPRSAARAHPHQRSGQVRVAVEQDDAALVRQETRAGLGAAGGDAGGILPGRLLRAVPAPPRSCPVLPWASTPAATSLWIRPTRIISRPLNRYSSSTSG
ncbi:MAG: PqqD family protein [Zoogloea sp.]|nr:PqqD family protein [Zoogloea sp.]